MTIPTTAQYLLLLGIFTPPCDTLVSVNKQAIIALKKATLWLAVSLIIPPSTFEPLNIRNRARSTHNPAIAQWPEPGVLVRMCVEPTLDNGTLEIGAVNTGYNPRGSTMYLYKLPMMILRIPLTNSYGLIGCNLRQIDSIFCKADNTTIRTIATRMH
jgi:hypothetical protein